MVLPLAAEKLKPGDTLVIKSVDGLSRNFEYVSEYESGGLIEVCCSVNSDRNNKGLKRGRKEKEPPATLEAVKAKWQCGEISARKAGEQLGVSHHTFLKWVKGQPDAK